MIRSNSRTRLLAAALAGLAGFVDAIGFIELGGFFVSFMSGNSTRLAVAAVDRSGGAALAGGLIALFVGGVVAGSLAGARAGRHRKPLVLLLVAGLLAAAAALADLGHDAAAVGAMVLAMGAENAVFERDGEVAIGLTYMTGALVKVGQQLATALRGGPRFDWLPNLLLWLGLIAGAGAGAFAFPRLGLDTLWVAAATALVFAAISTRV